MFYKFLFSGSHRPYQWLLIFLFLSAALLVRLFFGGYFGFCLWYVWLSGTRSTVPDLLTGGTDVLFCHYHPVWRLFILAVGIIAFNKEFARWTYLWKQYYTSYEVDRRVETESRESLVFTALHLRLYRRHSGNPCPCLENLPDRYH